MTRALLAQFSDGELLEELVRRKNGDDTGSRSDIKFCDECEHFKPYTGTRTTSTPRNTTLAHSDMTYSFATRSDTRTNGDFFVESARTDCRKTANDPQRTENHHGSVT